MLAILSCNSTWPTSRFLFLCNTGKTFRKIDKHFVGLNCGCSSNINTSGFQSLVSCCILFVKIFSTLLKKEKGQQLPDTVEDIAVRIDANVNIGHNDVVEVALALVGKEKIGHPNLVGIRQCQVLQFTCNMRISIKYRHSGNMSQYVSLERYAIESRGWGRISAKAIVSCSSQQQASWIRARSCCSDVRIPLAINRISDARRCTRLIQSILDRRRPG